MNKNSFLLILSILLLSSSFHKIHAQDSYLYGNIFDEQQNVLEYVNVILLSQDSVIVQGGVTDSQGNYNLKIPAGKYILQARAIGFKKANLNIDIFPSRTEQNICMYADSISLKEVVITSKKKLIKREIDRIIFDVSAIATGSNNALDILGNVPGVIVTNNNVKILGQEGVKILINGKEQKMSMDNLLLYLKSYQADQIDKIEIISVPSAEYDAEGSAGIVNFKLKKSENDYYNIGLYYGYSYNELHTNEANLNLRYNRNKINASVTVNGLLGEEQYCEKNTEEYDRFNRNNISSARSESQIGTLRGNLDYKINNNVLIGILTTFNNNKGQRNLKGESGFHSKESHLDSLLFSDNPRNTGTSLYRTYTYSDIKIDSLGKMLHIDVEYLRSMYSSDQSFLSKTYDSKLNLLNNSEYGFNNDNDRDVNSIISSLDFILPLKRADLKFGSKVSLTNTENKIQYYNNTQLEDQSDNFRFKENIFALYADYAKKLTSRLSFKSGLRLEYTNTRGYNDENTAAPLKDTYARLFPTIYFGYVPNESNRFTFSVSSRISRPSFRNINPFVTYTSKYTTISGKSDLKPYYTYKLNSGYTFKGNLTIEMYYSYIDNIFAQIHTINPDKLITHIYWENILKRHSWGINNAYFFNKLSWLQAYLIHSISYDKSYSNSPNTFPERNSLLYFAMINSSLFFNKRQTFTGWLNASYTSPEKLATTDTRESYNLNLGLQYALLNNKLKISLSLNNIVSSHVRGVVNSNDFKMSFNNKYSYTTARLGITYIIGTKLSGKRFENSDIQNRL
jgi:hypothetical protein